MAVFFSCPVCLQEVLKLNKYRKRLKIRKQFTNQLRNIYASVRLINFTFKVIASVLCARASSQSRVKAFESNSKNVKSETSLIYYGVL